jgi:hypothetical protein
MVTIPPKAHMMAVKAYPRMRARKSPTEAESNAPVPCCLRPVGFRPARRPWQRDPERIREGSASMPSVES